jgi:DnaK suppressor protein
MATIDLRFYREKLEALRLSLVDDMTHLEDDSLAGHAKTISIPTDREELGSDNADQELTLTLLESDETLLDQIEAALKRIEGGCYGRCDECGEDIPTTRLDAIPYAAECVRCAKTHEGFGSK